MTLCCCLDPNGKTSNQHVEMPTQIKFIHGISQEISLMQTQKSRKHDVKCNIIIIIKKEKIRREIKIYHHPSKECQCDG
jgi:hypothetical protein